MPAQPFMEQAVSDLLHNCTECKICIKACPFLEKYGLPKEIILQRKEEVFYCTNCSACSFLCKEGLDPAEALYFLKVSLLEEGSTLGEKLKKSALSFTKKIHSFPISHWEKAERIFWPGCSLWGTYPHLIKELLKILNKFSDKKIVLVLDCCLDPLYQIGALGETKKGWQELNQRFLDYGINEVIVACTNCYKIFKRFSNNLRVFHILEILPEEEFQNTLNKPFFHLPCPAFKEMDLKEKIVEKFKDKVDRVLPYPSCCGAGGGAYFSEEISESFLEKTLKLAGKRPILTFCFGCKNRFLKKGERALHLLETLKGIKPLESHVSSAKKWFNRIKFSLQRKITRPKSFFFLLFFLLMLISFYFQWRGFLKAEKLADTIKAFSGHPLSIILYLIIYTIAPSFFISSLALTLLAGFLWGPLFGGLIALTGATLGATLSFQLARYFFRESLKTRLGLEKWKYFDEITKKHGWKAVAFVRLFPLFPFPVVNYLFGLTSIDLKTYVICTFFFMAPAGFAYTGLGFSLKSILFEGKFFPLFLVLAFLFTLTILLRYLSKKWKL